jgi:Domain of unknown function (DUF4276)
MMNRLVLFVEGDGDVEAVPSLVKKLITEGDLWESVQLDNEPFRIGGVDKVSGRHQATWLKRLRAALKRPNLAGILVVLDGDARRWEGNAFCARDAACALVDRAKETGAGATYSLALVFACCEYETWPLAGLQSLAGKMLSDGRPGVREGTTPIVGDLESAPRGAKEALGKLMPNGYKPTLDQAELTKLLDLNEIRLRGLRSFARLESAIRQLCHACRTGQHVATPPSP